MQESWKYSTIPTSKIREYGLYTDFIYKYVEQRKDAEAKQTKWGCLEKLFGKKIQNINDSKNSLPNPIEHPCGETMHFFTFYTNSADLDCVITRNTDKKRYTIIFCGSESFLDWFYDLFVCKVSLPDGSKVHDGFHKQLTSNNSFDDMKNLIERYIFDEPKWDWYVTGHSSGGALSTLSAYLLSDEFSSVKWTVISLGSPRVGNKLFSDRFNNRENLRHFRLCNGRDIVTSLPYFGYYHCGYNLRYIDRKWISFGICQEVDGLFPKLKYSLFYFYSPCDHLCDRYITHLGIAQ
ncbi:MAG: hypothetical protein Dasosvirus13_3 [Dasosvirus sp.]|uniref:Fungal lipase-type domain-containing protein n=1 Tax=Dasosvirus sp. TaxID=2487764 RepID=A0A3G4ZRT7_9VIRU|nr:MAG: hypothetical protein Dasosvirus13_3 [Dasosvirus sp.]